MRPGSTGLIRNVLFIMCDQLRFDYLSCYGHPTLQTPNIDALAARGVRFSNAYVQSTVCGSSRMSIYTGRYVASHGAIWNFVPLPLGNLTLGDHLRDANVRVGLAGKTHMEPDRVGMVRCQIDSDSSLGTFIAECGFDPFDRDDGVWPEGLRSPGNRYSQYLRTLGYASDNPWHDHANSGIGAGGELLSGWQLRWARYPARVQEAHSETAYMTDRAMAFIREQGEKPWCLHLSYIKPHWPYVAPAPYNELYDAEDVVAVKQDPSERDNEHPVVKGFRDWKASRTFAKPEVRKTVIPTYMGLVKQIDDHVGRLMRFLEEQGRFDDTLVIFTSDHGDYLGDHYLGEKELFHDAVAKVPLIIADPTAGGRRGAVDESLVESIDILPTILDVYGVTSPSHIVEGRSLLPQIRNGTDQSGAATRQFVVSEGNYAFRREVRKHTERPVDASRMFMIRDQEWKYIHYQGLRPQLFNLSEDPDEYRDLALDGRHRHTLDRFKEILFDWLCERKIHTTIANESIAGWSERELEVGVRIGAW